MFNVFFAFHIIFIDDLIDLYKMSFFLLVVCCFFLNSELPSVFPNFEFRIVSLSVFMELERRALGETLTQGSPFQFREHGP